MSRNISPGDIVQGRQGPQEPAYELSSSGSGSTDSSTDSSATSSDDDSTSSSGGSSASASTNSSQRAPHTPHGRGAQQARAGATAPQQQQQQQQQQLRYIHLNPDLHFERPDNEYIPIPPMRDLQQVANVLRRLSVDKQRYPEGRHRMLDYFRVAVEMFVTEVRREYQQQFLSAQRNGKVMQRFTWKNSGELAICFACCCDMLKLLYDSLQPGPLKPLWDAFVGQLTPLLIIESRVPVNVLTEQTYHVKYMDWQKGGTRYNGDQSSNVRFPSAKDRRMKIETYLKSGAGYKLAVQFEPSTGGVAGFAAVAPMAAAAPLSAPLRAAPAAAAQALRSHATTAVVASPPPTLSYAASGPSTAAIPKAAPTAAIRAEEPRPPPFAGRLPAIVGTKTPLPPGATVARPPVKIPMKHAAGMSHTHAQSSSATAAVAAVPLASVGVKQMPQEMKHLFWLSVLAHVKGGDASRAFPDDRLEAMPGLLRLCEMTEETAEMRILMDVLTASSGGVQTVFERLGGLLSFRRFASHFLEQAEAQPLMQLVEQLAHWHVTGWGAASQQAWQTDAQQRRTADLTWLRTVPIIAEDKRAAWGALLLVIEQRFLFKAPRPEERGGAGVKRPRQVDDGADLRAVLNDNVDMQRWTVPRVNVFAAVRLPVELRVPPLCTRLEQSTVQFLNAKRAYAETTQREWRGRLEKVLATQPPSHAAVPVPLWYDPYELLGIVAPKPKIMPY